MWNLHNARGERRRSRAERVCDPERSKTQLREPFVWNLHNARGERRRSRAERVYAPLTSNV
ncbi:hypothetical protein HMPREF9999_00465 [Alloprevotella sp. oral taxon 473 str. F0040]|nr:hypothetical protein HMPREF9999_00465 [Alloprevotella sp. oral taxon 473 str. F0040]